MKGKDTIIPIQKEYHKPVTGQEPGTLEDFLALMLFEKADKIVKKESADQFYNETKKQPHESLI